MRDWRLRLSVGPVARVWVAVSLFASGQMALPQTATDAATDTAVKVTPSGKKPVYPELAARLDGLWRRELVPQRAFAGAAVVDAASGELLFSRNGTMLFVPASNAKLYSTALALSRLGPDYRLETELRMEGEFLPASGQLKGDLVLVGKGDPSIGGRQYPYSRDTERQRDDSLPGLEAFVDAVVARGLRVVEGDIIGDDTAYLWEPFHEGWAQDDALFEYGAPVSALTLNDSAVRLTIRAGSQPGEPVDITIQPESEYFDILNEVTTVKGVTARLEWERIPGQRLLVLRGELPPGAPARMERVAVDDPALFTAHVLRQALLRRGVTVRGNARARHRLPAESFPAGVIPDAPPASTLVHLRLSPPLSELITVVNKESQNLHAELLLREVARVKNGIGSRLEAINEMRRFLASAGVVRDGAMLTDASGLARLNLVSPESTATLLSAMWKGPHRDLWVASLPIGGDDGTLRNRFASNPLASAVSAKTGTLRGVTALGGYARTRSGRVLAFSVMVNNHGGPGSQARAFLDTIAIEIASLP
ncbi:MAG: D-alanyl-D-alanine carboxypeptidase/D-alanyl-D-alanine-endopeptidase [Bryobacterales bacterium]|nr:D-alanyl-D-alanine carboxypeptidase/D-alanyl-D-alanine-endopeptidase [Bryobacterales bacterium]